MNQEDGVKFNDLKANIDDVEKRIEKTVKA